MNHSFLGALNGRRHICCSANLSSQHQKTLHLHSGKGSQHRTRLVRSACQLLCHLCLPAIALFGEALHCTCFSSMVPAHTKLGQWPQECRALRHELRRTKRQSSTQDMKDKEQSDETPCQASMDGYPRITAAHHMPQGAWACSNLLHPASLA